MVIIYIMIDKEVRVSSAPCINIVLYFFVFTLIYFILTLNALPLVFLSFHLVCHEGAKQHLSLCMGKPTI